MNKKPCEDVAKIPASFRELEMPPDLAAIFDAAGMTPGKMIRQARRYGLFGNLVQRDGRFVLAIEHIREEDTLLPTGLRDVYFRGNFYQSGIPFLSDYIRRDARQQMERIRKEFYTPYLHGCYYVDGDSICDINRCASEFCLDHYDSLGEVHADYRQMKTIILTIIRKEYPFCLGLYKRLLSEAERSHEKEVKEYDDTLRAVLLSVSRRAIVREQVKQVFYVGHPPAA